MIDVMVVLQACAAGLIVRRAMHEPHKWDRAGFVMLACSAALMTFRRVTIALDRFLLPEGAILPYAIAWTMMAAATCFTVELLHRIHVSGSLLQATRWTKYAGPFAVMLLMSATDFVPVQRWNGEPVHVVTPDEAVSNIVRGHDVAEACEIVQSNCSKGIDALRILAAGDSPDADLAREKLAVLAARFDAIQRSR